MRSLRRLRHFHRDETGATALEYGLITAMISATIILAALAIGGNIQLRFGEVETAVAEGEPQT